MKYHPTFQLIFTFFLLVLGGFLLLYFYGFTPGREEHRVLDALFTSTSAVCVTGLSVVDISKDCTLAGQIIIMVLIQLGGIGILTLSNWILHSFTKQLNVGQVQSTKETFGSHERQPISNVLKHVFIYTFIVELLGTLLLFLGFLSDMPFGKSLWFALFHSIAAFCNAGFSLFSDNMIGYQDDPFVLAVLIALILCGGVGFLSASDIVETLSSRRRGVRRKFSLQTKMVLAVNGVLVFGGFFAFILFEWQNTFANLSFSDMLMNSMFLSVLSRTAGFNSVDTYQLTNMSLVVLLLLMAVGASSGSTGGGIKVTTAAVFWAFLTSRLREHEQAVLFRTAIPYETISKSVLVILSYSLMVFIAVALLQLTEFGSAPHSITRGSFLEHLFEVISALSTVGLTAGLTPNLSPYGQLVIIGCMFIGRIGPLVIVSSVISKRKARNYAYPEENLMVG